MSASRSGAAQIIGVAGVEGNGQSELMRALAGLQPSKGEVALNGPNAVRQPTLLAQTAFMPSDRHAEGLAGDLTVRENAAFSALDQFAVDGHPEPTQGTGAGRPHLRRSGGQDAGHRSGGILSLSGGNQQKVVMARALLSEPRLHHRR